MARTGQDGPKGVSTFIVRKDDKGVSFGANEKKMGWNSQPTRQVIFEDVRIPASRRVGAEGDGFRFAMAGLDGGRLNIAACSLGGMQEALDKALAYTKERKQFGQAIADFQATQFKLADMETETQAARVMLYNAAQELDAKTPHGDALVRDGQAVRDRHRVQGGQRCAAAAWRLWLSVGLWRRADRARSARAPDPRGDERGDAGDHLAGHAEAVERSMLEKRGIDQYHLMACLACVLLATACASAPEPAFTGPPSIDHAARRHARRRRPDSMRTASRKRRKRGAYQREQDEQDVALYLHR